LSNNLLRETFMTRLTKTAQYAAIVATLASVALDASAATIRVECEARPGRAKISVDGKSLGTGSFRSQVVSGTNMAQSGAVVAVGGEVQTDYDSNPADINAGATAISSTLITGGSVTGKILDASGNTVISDTVACRVRTR
jgi:hypothetical protein